MRKFEQYSKLWFTSILILPSLLYCPISADASYSVQTGDSLSKIAKAKYGDWLKWKNIWQANEDQVKNPDLIYPGQRLRLLNETDIDLYAASDASIGSSGNMNDSGSTPTPVRHSKKSDEWRLLPTQPWEKFVFKVDPTIDPDGFDRRSRVAVRIAEKTNAEITIASDRIPILGEIVNARTEFERVFIGQSVFIRADEALQVGTVYSVTTGPQKVVSKRDSRVGYAYDLTGKVRIIGVRDGVFIGTVTALYHPIQRHQLLIPVVNAYEFPEAKVASTAVAASVVVTQDYQEDLLGEQKTVFLDVGKDDGVAVGNIFRHYLHDDPNNQEVISSKDFLIESELQVLVVQDKFSVAVILSSRNPLHYGDDAIALTDIADLNHNQGLQSLVQDHDKIDNVDQLDQMDQSEGLGEKENHELRQLEKWTKPAPVAPLQPETATDNDEIKRLDVHQNARPTVEVGRENAPNDHSDQPPAPKSTPAPNSSDKKDTNGVPNSPPTSTDTAPAPDAPPITAPVQNDPGLDAAPIQEAPPPPPPPQSQAQTQSQPQTKTPSSDAPASNTDPFAIPAEPPTSP